MRAVSAAEILAGIEASTVTPEPDPLPPPDRELPIGGVARMFGVSPGTVRRWCQEEGLPCHTDERGWRHFWLSDLTEFSRTYSRRRVSA